MLLTSLGSMYANGGGVRWEAIYAARGRNVPLPGTAWQRRRDRLPDAQNNGGRLAAPAAGTLHPLLGQVVHSATKPDEYIAQTVLAANQPLYLGDHRVYSAAVFPAAAYAEMALAVVQQMGGQRHCALENFKFEKALTLPDSGSVLIQVGASRRLDKVELEYFSCATPESAADDAAWTRHARGTVRHLEVQAVPGIQPLALEDFIAAADEQIGHDTALCMMNAHGLSYGPYFRGIKSLWRRGRQVLAQLALPQEVADELSRDQIHPAVLDLAFQSVAACLDVPQAAHRHETLLPVALQSLHFYGPPQHAAYAHAVLGDRLPLATQKQLTADVFLLDSAGSILVAARGLVLQRLDREAGGESKAAEQLLYEITWRTQPPVAASNPVPSTNAPRWLLLGPDTNLREQLVCQLQQAGGDCATYTTGHDQGHLDPACPEQIERCLIGLAEAGRAPAAVVMLTAQEAAADDASAGPVGYPCRQGSPCGVDQPDPVLGAARCPAAAAPLDRDPGTQPVQDNDPIALDQAPLWGAVRTAALEVPALRRRAIDLCALPEEEDGWHVVQEVLADGPENLVAYRGGRRLVPRMVPYAPPAAPLLRAAVPDEAYRLEIPAPGILDRLTLAAAVRVPPGPDQVEIRCTAPGSTFSTCCLRLACAPTRKGWQQH